VAFAEIDRFVDTPVKRYSSGMYVRLAFAVAAHLEPEILLVDEVLAVGDSAFQKKCLGKMDDVARDGRTVLFVSHDMTNVSVLCDSALLLGKGTLLARGPTQVVIDAYVSQGTDRRSSVTWDPETAPGDGVAALRRVDVRGAEGLPTDAFSLSEPLVLRVEYDVLRDHCRLNPVFAVKNLLGTTIFTSANYEDQEWGARLYHPGSYVATCRVPPHVLNDGTYLVDVLLVEDARFIRAMAESAIEFSMYDDGVSRGGYVGPWHGIVRPRCEWNADELT
jgi:lipopolysaccharide transport system ATP-binding protein